MRYSDNIKQTRHIEKELSTRMLKVNRTNMICICLKILEPEESNIDMQFFFLTFKIRLCKFEVSFNNVCRECYPSPAHIHYFKNISVVAVFFLTQLKLTWITGGEKFLQVDFLEQLPVHSKIEQKIEFPYTSGPTHPPPPPLLTSYIRRYISYSQ